MKRSPGRLVLNTVGCIPELSTAVGSVQVTLRDGVPNGTVLVKDSGQLRTVGRMVSTPITKPINQVIVNFMQARFRCVNQMITTEGKLFI